ncbi:MAG: phosphate ABC transporter permease subunit PstC [Planctomycetes bacterium]|nr:phosphate ABC transporter permease subunit PstC [Planctomycetota bacterium]
MANPAKHDSSPKPQTGRGDLIFRWLCQASGLLVFGVAGGLVAVLVWQSWPVLADLFTYKLLNSDDWNPNSRPPVFGSLVFVYGTLVTSFLAMMIAIPLGVGAAAFLSEIAPFRVRKICSFLVEILAAIPSVVYGFWGLFFLAPMVQRFFSMIGGPSHASGQGILCSSLILAIMVLPYIIAISFDACQSVPRTQREGSLALGATRWQMIWGVVLPYARPGIIAACFLALGRALGETKAVTMLIGNVRYIDVSLFASGDSIASVIANQLNEAGSQLHRSALVALGLLLFLITAATNIIARMLIARSAKPRPRKGTPYAFELKTVNGKPPSKFVEAPSHRRSARLQNTIMTWVLAGCQIVTIGPLFLILGYVAWRGSSSIDWDFFTTLPKPPGELGGGLAHAMLGSAQLVLIASLFAVPIGVLCAVFLTEFKNHRLTGPVRFIAEILGGVPSIVIGIFAYAVLVRPPWTAYPGFSAWAGIFALGIMMLPVVIRTSEEAIKMVPNSLREASYALGASQWNTMARVILPAALPAIITGVLLSMGRIAGETAPLILTCRGSNYWPGSLGDPMPFLPGYIYEYAKSADKEQQRQAWAAALVLLGVVLFLNVAIRLMSGKRIVAASRAG